MTTATTTTVIDQSTDAAFRTWVAEIITALVTTCGVTQTADTGQINTATVTRAAINTAAGYVILRFNDTAQSTSPIFIKLEFGSGSATTEPSMWITVGTGSNGSGTLTGTTTTRQNIVGGTHASSVTSYVSRWCYNATDGILAMCWKIGGVSGGNLGTILIARTTDSSGASTTNAYVSMTNGSTTSPIGSTGTVQIYSYTSSALLTLGNALQYVAQLYASTSLNTGGNIYVIPMFFTSPVPGIMAMVGFAILADIALGTTVTLALVGSTTHTFVSVGQFYGASAPGNISGGTWLMIWE